MKIIIMRDQLIAALCTAAKEDIRSYLNGVYIEATNMETRVISSNGAVVAVQRADAKGENEVEGVVQMIIPRGAIEKIKNHKVLRTVELNDEGGRWGIVDFDTRTGFIPVDGKFPDYRRTLPASLSGEVMRFDPALLAMFVKAAAAFGTKSSQVLISSGGQGGALVSIGRDDEYIGVLMPLRDAVLPPPLTTSPAWSLAAPVLETAEADLV